MTDAMLILRIFLGLSGTVAVLVYLWMGAPI